MQHLGRVRIISTIINKFLVNLKRHHPDFYDGLSEELKNLYKNDKSLSVFSLIKPSESSKTLEQVSHDLFDLCQFFKDYPEVQNMSSYALLLRVLNEQCAVTGKTAVANQPKKFVPILFKIHLTPMQPTTAIKANVIRFR